MSGSSVSSGAFRFGVAGGAAGTAGAAGAVASAPPAGCAAAPPPPTTATANVATAIAPPLQRPRVFMGPT